MSAQLKFKGDVADAVNKYCTENPRECGYIHTIPYTMANYDYNRHTTYNVIQSYIVITYLNTSS